MCRSIAPNFKLLYYSLTSKIKPRKRCFYCDFFLQNSGPDEWFFSFPRSIKAAIEQVSEPLPAGRGHWRELRSDRTRAIYHVAYVHRRYTGGDNNVSTESWPHPHLDMTNFVQSLVSTPTMGAIANLCHIPGTIPTIKLRGKKGTMYIHD